MTKSACCFLCAAFLLLPSCGSQLPLMAPEPNDTEQALVTGWLSLSNGTFHPDDEDARPDGYYVKVRRKSWETFQPLSEILGKGAPVPESAKRQPGWLELDDGSIHPMQEAIVPRPPYVRGFIDENGTFYPDPLKITK